MAFASRVMLSRKASAPASGDDGLPQRAALSLALAAPPRVTIISLRPSACPVEPDTSCRRKFHCVLAADPTGLLRLLLTPLLLSERDEGELRTRRDASGVERTFRISRIPTPRYIVGATASPVPDLGVIAAPGGGGPFMVADFQRIVGGREATFLSFSSESGEWVGKFWWVDRVSGLFTCDSFAIHEPAMEYVRLPDGDEPLDLDMPNFSSRLVVPFGLPHMFFLGNIGAKCMKGDGQSFTGRRIALKGGSFMEALYYSEKTRPQFSPIDEVIQKVLQQRNMMWEATAFLLDVLKPNLDSYLSSRYDDQPSNRFFTEDEQMANLSEFPGIAASPIVDCNTEQTLVDIQSNIIQLYIRFGELKKSVFVSPQTTVREAISEATDRIGIKLHSYYIIHCSRYLNLNATVSAQGLQSGSELSPMCRLRGGAMDRITFLEPYVDFTNRFGDEIFDLCYIPGAQNGPTICLGLPGARISTGLVSMIHRWFAMKKCVPAFTAADIVYDHINGCFKFVAGFQGVQRFTSERFRLTMTCLGVLIDRTFRYNQQAFTQGRPHLRVIPDVPDVEDEDDELPQLDGVLPQYVQYLVNDLMDIRNIVVGAKCSELMNYIQLHIGSRTSHGRMIYEVGLAHHFGSYHRGGYAAFDAFMHSFETSWWPDMHYPLDLVRGFYDMSPDYSHRPVRFCQHVKNFILHSITFGVTAKQAEALVMLHAARFVHLVTIDVMLRIPLNMRVGGQATPAPPLVLEIANPHGPRRPILTDFTIEEIFQI